MKLFFLFFASLSIAQTPYISPAKVLLKKGVEYRLYGDYFQTSKLVDKDGKSTSLSDGSSFQRAQYEASLSYGLTNQLQLLGGMRYRQNQSETSTTTLKGNGLESTFIQLKYGFKKIENIRYAIEGFYRYHTFSNEELSASPKNMIIGDDGNEYSFGLVGGYESKSGNYLSMRGGYRKPGQELSPEIYWQAEGALSWTKLALVGGVEGVSSLNQDPYKSDLSQKPQFSTGVTNLYNSYHRSFVTPYLGVNYAFTKNWRLEGRAFQTVAGRSTDLGQGFSLSVARRTESFNETKKIDTRFKDYDIEANVTKVSPKKNFVILDKGIADDIEKGMKFDLYEFDYLGGNVLTARGVIIQVKSDTSVLKITQRFNSENDLKEGLIARAAK